MKLFLRIFVPVLLMAAPVFAQPNLDKVWVQGSWLSYKTTFGNPPVNQFWNATPSNIIFWYGQSNICDANGNLLIVTTGGDIYDANKNIIENGDTIVPVFMYTEFEGAGPNPQGSIILPFQDSIYYVFTNTMSDTAYHHHYNLGDTLYPTFNQLLYNVVDMKLNAGAGEIAKRMQPALGNTNIAPSRMTACRHGSGKDWWLVQLGYGSNSFYKFLVMKDTVLGPFIQSFSTLLNIDAGWAGQAVFNNKGDKYAVTTDDNRIFIADFDRCTGILSAPKIYNVPDQFNDTTTVIDSTLTGLAFSPSDSFLYVSSWFNIQQLELNNLDSASAWVKIAGIDTIYSAFQEYETLYLGHDNKLYVGNFHTQYSGMSVINKPDLKGLPCQFCPKCMHFPGNGVANPPNMPNYKLGAKTPSCDSAQFVASGPQAGILRIFPNPADASIIIEYESSGRFELADMLGRVLLQADLVKGQNRMAIKTDHLPAGLYAYRYTSEKGGQITGKLVISH